MQGYLAIALEDRMKYKRNYKGRPKPKCSDGKAGESSKKTTMHHPKAAVTVEPMGTKDDNAAVQRNIKVMQAEYKKIHPNKQVTFYLYGQS